MASPQPVLSRFESVPAEVRSLIYGYIISDLPKYFFKRLTPAGRLLESDPLAIMLTNKRVYKEFRGELWLRDQVDIRTRFTLDVGDGSWRHNYCITTHGKRAFLKTASKLSTVFQNAVVDEITFSFGIHTGHGDRADGRYGMNDEVFKLATLDLQGLLGSAHKIRTLTLGLFWQGPVENDDFVAGRILETVSIFKSMGNVERKEVHFLTSYSFHRPTAKIREAILAARGDIEHVKEI